MSEINDLLNPNEKILWKRIRVRNLVLTYPIYILSILMTFFLIYFSIYPGIVAINYNKIFIGIGLILTGIVLEIAMIFSEIYVIRKSNNIYRRILKVPKVELKVELKEYKIINAISNQRIIKKDIRNLRSMKRCVKEESISSIKFDKDYLFLDLRKVKTILFSKDLHRIGFSLNKTDNIPLILN